MRTAESLRSTICALLADEQRGCNPLHLNELLAHLAEAHNQWTIFRKGAPSLDALDLLGRALEYVESYVSPAEASDKEASAAHEDAQALAQSIREALHVAVLSKGETLSRTDGETINGQLFAALADLVEWAAGSGADQHEIREWKAAKGLLESIRDLRDAKRITIDEAAKPSAAPELLEALEMAAKLIPIARNHFPKSIRNADRFQLELTCAAISKAINAATKGDTVRDQLLAALHTAEKTIRYLRDATPLSTAAYAQTVVDLGTIMNAIAAAERGRPETVTPPLQWWAVACLVTLKGSRLEAGTVYARAVDAESARTIAARHVWDTWAHTERTGEPGASDLMLNTDAPQLCDETDPRFNRPESVFTDDGRTHPGA